MARVSLETRLKVVSLRQQGLSQAKISKQTGISRGAVQALLQKHKKTGQVEDRKRSGRPRKLSGADEQHITSLRNQKMSSSDITSELAVTRGTLVDPSTVRRSLARNGLTGRPAERKQQQQLGCDKNTDGTLTKSEKDKDCDKVEKELRTDGCELKTLDSNEPENLKLECEEETCEA